VCAAGWLSLQSAVSVSPSPGPWAAYLFTQPLCTGSSCCAVAQLTVCCFFSCLQSAFAPQGGAKPRGSAACGQGVGSGARLLCTAARRGKTNKVMRFVHTWLSANAALFLLCFRLLAVAPQPRTYTVPKLGWLCLLPLLWVSAHAPWLHGGGFTLPRQPPSQRKREFACLAGAVSVFTKGELHPLTSVTKRCRTLSGHNMVEEKDFKNTA